MTSKWVLNTITRGDAVVVIVAEPSETGTSAYVLSEPFGSVANKIFKL